MRAPPGLGAEALVSHPAAGGGFLRSRLGGGSAACAAGSAISRAASEGPQRMVFSGSSGFQRVPA
eukprot:11206144-Alexandrium_andersonii.AAC.1